MLSHDPPQARGPRVLGWVAIALAGLALALVAVSQQRGASVNWIAWALPLLIAASVAASTFGLLRPWPRVARFFPYLSLAVAVAILIAEMASFTHR